MCPQKFEISKQRRPQDRAELWFQREQCLRFWLQLDLVQGHFLWLQLCIFMKDLNNKVEIALWNG